VARMIFVNLPVTDLERSTRFYEAVGFRKDERFSDATTSGMALDEHIHVMLLSEPRFQEFLVDQPVADYGSREVLVAVSAGSREEVDDLLARAVAAGGRQYRDTTDLVFMYGCAFADPDGHVWEAAWLDPAGPTEG
jgi:predicted lactoylglutathione lyase